MGVVTVSAAYGAAGAEVARAVAERLGLPFHDRAIAAQVAGRLGVPVAEAEANDETVVARPVAAGRARWAPCPTRWAACSRRRPSPTRGPTGSRPSGCSPRSPTAPAGWCSAGRRDGAAGPPRRAARAAGRPAGTAAGRRGRALGPAAGRGAPRDGGQRPGPGGLRAALLPLRPGRVRGTTTWWSTPRRCRSTSWSSWWSPPPAPAASATEHAKDPGRPMASRGPGGVLERPPRRAPARPRPEARPERARGEGTGCFFRPGRPCRRGCTRCTR